MTRKRPYPSRAFRLMCAVLLVVGPFPVTAFAKDGTSRSWSDDIPQLLAAGQYEEGVVLACVDASRLTLRTTSLL